MTRDEARQFIDQGSLTWGDLQEGLHKEIAMAALSDGGVSELNPALTKAQALDILAKAIDRRNSAENVSTGDEMERLMASNCLRECTEVWP